MYTFGNRASNVVQLGVMILVLLCFITSVCDNFHDSSPSANVQVLRFNRFRKRLDGNDEVKLKFNVTANLQTLFTWNTKQVFVFLAAEYATRKNSVNEISIWDGIIQSKEHGAIQIQAKNKYHLIDQGSNLKGKNFNLTLHWHVMPKTGKMHSDKIVMTGYQFPETYTNPLKTDSGFGHGVWT